MAENFAALGGFIADESIAAVDVPSDMGAIIEAVEKIRMNSPMGYVLTEEEVAILSSYLPAIGADEETRDDSGSLQAKATAKYSAEGAGISVDVIGDVSVESRWHADRKQWSGELKLQKTGGEAKAKELAFQFYYMSIGKDEQGNFIVLYNEHYSRVFTDPYHLNDFNSGNVADASRYDISKHPQCGYFILVSCNIRTNEGTLTV